MVSYKDLSHSQAKRCRPQLESAVVLSDRSSRFAFLLRVDFSQREGLARRQTAFGRVQRRTLMKDARGRPIHSSGIAVPIELTGRCPRRSRWWHGEPGAERLSRSPSQSTPHQMTDRRE